MTDNAQAQAQAAPQPKVTLVIGSGSVKCAAGLGVAKALADAGIGIERVVGCSAGAIFGSMVALKLPLERAMQDARTLWTPEITSSKSRMALPRMIAPRLFGFKPTNFGLRHDGPMMRLVNGYYRDMLIEDTPIPFHITATDLANGELVELSTGRIAEAVRASIAIPFAFAPVQLLGRTLVDGYLSDPLPVSVAIRNGAQVIVAIGFENPDQERINSVGRFAFQISAIMSNNLLKSRLAFHNAVHHTEMITVIPEFEQRVRLFDIDKIGYIIEEGERAANRQMPYLRRLLGLDPT